MSVRLRCSWPGSGREGRLRETRGPSSPAVTPLRECTLEPRQPHMWSRDGRIGRWWASATHQSPASWCPSTSLRHC
ncbi:hypothetical protein DPMN_109159 [Dreissena polymorpha]|uniref:Uncharacterized protein n=1 Tax=Dreissena polymorpha TaxID=45954 RepID=A0A9D4KA60_DREPO|nr:hypothetical protein DPMN_109159 [Dreissena polymorpha]